METPLHLSCLEPWLGHNAADLQHDFRARSAPLSLRHRIFALAALFSKRSIHHHRLHSPSESQQRSDLVRHFAPVLISSSRTDHRLHLLVASSRSSPFFKPPVPGANRRLSRALRCRIWQFTSDDSCDGAASTYFTILSGFSPTLRIASSFHTDTREPGASRLASERCWPSAIPSPDSRLVIHGRASLPTSPNSARRILKRVASPAYAATPQK